MPADPTTFDLGSIDRLDPIIHSPTRMKILALLSVVESADFTFLLRQAGLTRGNLSVNLRKLEEAGYVTVSKEFVDRIPRTLAQMTEEGHSAVRDYREMMRGILDDLL